MRKRRGVGMALLCTVAVIVIMCCEGLRDSAYCGEHYLVKDINNTGPEPLDSMTNVNGVLYFTVNDRVYGWELWRSDGTPAGTYMVKAINLTGDVSGFGILSYLLNVNGVVYFNADDGVHGEELWRSDGTSAGTYMVKDINQAGHSYPGELTNVNGVVYFSADDGVHGEELWRSDGTSAGTHLVTDINIAGSSSPGGLTNVNGVLHFWADDGVHGDKLWRSDGTSAGTYMVKDTDQAGQSSPGELMNVNGPLYFRAVDGARGKGHGPLDTLPVLRINDVGRVEGNAGVTAYTFTVTLSPASIGTAAVNYTTVNGTAAAGSDYTAARGMLTFAPGETSKRVTVNVAGDTMIESNETFFVNLSNAVGATIFDSQGQGTILNDDGPVLRVTDVGRVEGNAGVTAYTFTVRLSPASAGTVTVNYTTVNGTAAAGSDYTAARGMLTFAPGETSKRVTVNVAGDTTIESNETFFVNLSNAVGATIFDSQGQGTILNDDGPVLRVSDVDRIEGNAGVSAFNFFVTLSSASTGTVTVNYTTVNGTAVAGSDYTAVSGTLTFTAGQVIQMVTVNVIGDTAVEPNETFYVNLLDASGASIFDARGAGTIVNDDGPVLRVSDVSKAEGNTGTAAFTFTVTLSPASTGTVTVNYTAVNGTAVAGSDYTAASGRLTFGPGETSKRVTVNVMGDTAVEGNETFHVNLLNASGASIFDAWGLGAIVNDDGPVLAINDVSQPEPVLGWTAFTFIVTLSPASTNTVTVNYATAEGTARAGWDYMPTSRTLTFAPGETSKTVTVDIIVDWAWEPNETFYVNLSNAVGATIFDGQGQGTIFNDDCMVGKVCPLNSGR